MNIDSGASAYFHFTMVDEGPPEKGNRTWSAGNSHPYEIKLDVGITERRPPAANAPVAPDWAIQAVDTFPAEWNDAPLDSILALPNSDITLLPEIPTLTPWGMIAVVGLLIALGIAMLILRRRAGDAA